MAWLLKSAHIDPYERNWHSPYIACYQDEDVARAELAEIKEEIAKFGECGFLRINGSRVTIRVNSLLERSYQSKLHNWFSDGRYRCLFFNKLTLIEVPSR